MTQNGQKVGLAKRRLSVSTLLFCGPAENDIRSAATMEAIQTILSCRWKKAKVYSECKLAPSFFPGTICAFENLFSSKMGKGRESWSNSLSKDWPPGQNDFLPPWLALVIACSVPIPDKPIDTDSLYEVFSTGNLSALSPELGVLKSLVRDARIFRASNT